MTVRRTLIMTVAHFISMYFLMYLMVDSFDNVILNLNNFYMAAVMTAPMLIIESLLMNSSHENGNTMKIMGAAGFGALVSGIFLIRQQAFIYDKEFIRSMIPHHAGAIFMCDEADISDTELQDLCQEIIESQQREIDQMNSILRRLD